MRIPKRLIAVAASAAFLFSPSTHAAETVAPTAALSAEAPAASENPISGPVLGYLFDPSERRLRPIFGIPGASFIGGPLVLNVDLIQAEISPAGDYALGVDAAGTLYRIDLRNGAASVQTISGAISGVDRIFISPTGAAAAVYDRQGRTVQILTGLHSRPTAGGVVELGGLPGVITALAASDDGRTILVGTATRDGGALYSGAPGAGLQRIAPAGQIVSIAFLPNSSDALAADLRRQEALRITGIGRSPAVTVIASAADGLRSPIAVAGTADGSAAIIASSQSRAIVRVAFSGGSPQVFECECAPRRLTAMTSDSLFRLTDDPNQPIYLFDADHKSADGATLEPRVLFVPAAAGAADGEGASFAQARRAVRGR